jgi:Tfp pilus assembly protein PilO
MKRLSPEKRNQLIMVIVATLALIGMVYFFLIGPQINENRKLHAAVETKEARLKDIKRAIAEAGDNANKAVELDAQLKNAESDEASGDVIAWSYFTIQHFKAGRHVDISTIGQPVVSDVDLLPNFPGKEIKFQILGSGYYSDIGKFIADLENEYPHIRVLNLNLDPNTGPDIPPEKLSFRMDIVALLKPST